MRITATDIVVIGGSAGSLEALCNLVAGLPADLPAALFIVVHVLPVASSRLPQILERRSALPVRHARDGDTLERGHILVAPPDHHMVLSDHRVELNRGPRENSTRPAIDPLFRSAANQFGPRVCAVVVSGNLDDGSAGLRHVMARGGAGIVQDPDDALHPEMPRNALLRCPSCDVAPSSRIAGMLVELARSAQSAEQSTMQELEKPGRSNSSSAEQIGAADSPGTPTGLTCPECHGVLWASPDPADPTLHCRIGHSYSLETLQSERRLEIEAAMGAAVRALHEEASLARHIAERARRSGRESMAHRFDIRAATAMSHAHVLEGLLLEDIPLPASIAPDEDEKDDDAGPAAERREAG